MALRNRVTEAAPQLVGATLEATWRSVLRRPERYRLMTPTAVVPDTVDARWQPWRAWLAARYLT
jgi:hypothetical protein